MMTPTTATTSKKKPKYCIASDPSVR